MANGFGHEYEHEHDHEYDHEYDHKYEHKNDHNHGHKHDHKHDHKHEPTHEQFEKHKKVCTVNTSEDITITTPIILSAYADSSKVELKCNGYDIIKESHCKPHTSKFKIRQKIRACIPIEFVAECDVGKGHVDFDFDNN